MGRAGIEQLLYAFDRSLEGDPATPPGNWDAPAVNAREGHRLFGACIEGLTDDEQLFERRLGPQGELQETRWLIATMIEHNLSTRVRLITFERCAREMIAGGSAPTGWQSKRKR